MNKLVIFIVILFTAYSCKNTATYPIREPSAEMMDDRIMGKWKFSEDTNKLNYYEVYLANKECCPNQYHIRFWNRGGSNPSFESNGHFSKIGKETFFNVPYFETRETPHAFPVTGDDKYEMFPNSGFMFLHILEANKAYDKITAAVVGDTTMRSLENSEQVYNFVKANMNKPAFYSDTVHLYKISE